ncbi:MAG: CCA tRNA nucleotidyltransferase [Bacillus sp. (in: Bacteria)]|nr:CCA tRNA nucleotidyltransferase [Bacillus sp. (in: firmicutes)]MCM1425373.1 CCA tRNA nucleotidyltransferase [Eubacterium sp.]
MDVRIQLPQKVRYIIETIQAAGYEAYAVGGCIRDSILGKEPDDWDITTSATPREVKKLFHRTIDTGIKHGTVTVMMDKERFEVTTYRIDGEYEDGRHPKEVTFTSQLSEDLRRRDFTINAIAYNEQDGLIDIFEGIQDMERKVIRCVGDARERFTEDALRMMRAVRFSAQLGYTIEEETKKAIKELAPTLQNISAERIQTELVKLLVSKHPEDIRTAYETGITAQILPEFDICMETKQNNPHHCYNVGEHIIHTLIFVEPDKVLRLGMFFHDIGKPQTLTIDEKGITHNHGHAAVGEEMTVKILKRLKFDNDTLDKVRKLVRYHDRKIELSAKSVRRAVNTIGEDIFPMLFAVKYADIMAQSDYQREEKLRELETLREIYDKILERKECFCLKDLAVSGSDLIAAGMEPGKEIGVTLHKLLEDVLENPEHNQKEYLLSLLPSRD